MLSFSFAHGYDGREASRRLVVNAPAEELEVTFDEGSEMEGRVTAQSPLGPVTAHFISANGAVQVEVLASPKFVPAGIVRAAIEEKLQRVLR